MDGAGSDAWSAAAEGWSELWSSCAEPAQQALLDAAGVGPGTRLLDVGCGSGELLELASRRGAEVAGVDPAPGMRALAAARAVDAEVRDGDAEHLPWPDRTFDVALAVNALQFADDADAALAELARVTVPGGIIGVANWAEAGRNDLTAVEEAVARFHEQQLPPDDELRLDGGLEGVLRSAGLEVLDSGLVPAPWEVADEAALVRGILLGEDAVTITEVTPTVLAAASPFRTTTGGYCLMNAFRWSTARTRGEPGGPPPVTTRQADG